MSTKTESISITTKKKKNKEKNIASARGRIFNGIVTKKFPTRVAVEFERTVYVSKYRRYYKKKTRIHARLPQHINVNIGDLVKIQECRPLSKIIHFIVTEKLKGEQK